MPWRNLPSTKAPANTHCPPYVSCHDTKLVAAGDIRMQSVCGSGALAPLCRVLYIRGIQSLVVRPYISGYPPTNISDFQSQPKIRSQPCISGPHQKKALVVVFFLPVLYVRSTHSSNYNTCSQHTPPSTPCPRK